MGPPPSPVREASWSRVTTGAPGSGKARPATVAARAHERSAARRRASRRGAAPRRACDMAPVVRRVGALGEGDAQCTTHRWQSGPGATAGGAPGGWEALRAGGGKPRTLARRRIFSAKWGSPRSLASLIIVTGLEHGGYMPPRLPGVPFPPTQGPPAPPTSRVGSQHRPGAPGRERHPARLSATPAPAPAPPPGRPGPRTRAGRRAEPRAGPPTAAATVGGGGRAGGVAAGPAGLRDPPTPPRAGRAGRPGPRGRSRPMGWPGGGRPCGAPGAPPATPRQERGGSAPAPAVRGDPGAPPRPPRTSSAHPGVAPVGGAPGAAPRPQTGRRSRGSGRRGTLRGGGGRGPCGRVRVDRSRKRMPRGTARSGSCEISG